MAESVQPTEAELDDIALCAQKLWDLDTNKLQPEVHYNINVQEGKRTRDAGDAAGNKLFRDVEESIFQRPTYGALRRLFDNYIRETGTTEVMTEEERGETNAFIDEVMKSAPMQYVHRYLVNKGLASADESEFKQQLFSLWFNFYRRNVRNDSSGFEHVFLGESDDGVTKGFHNWIQFYLQERDGAVDYKGHILSNRGPEPDAYERLIQLQLDWDGERKRISSIFVGSSPEFELALYTLYFLAGKQDNYANLLNYRINVKCYRIHGDRIGTVYVIRVDES